MLCSPPTSLKQREPDDLLSRHTPQPSRAAGSFSHPHRTIVQSGEGFA